MTEQTPQDETKQQEKQKPEPRDAAYWAGGYAETLKVAGVAEGATNINVEGRRAVGPLQGFGKLWQKTYRVSLVGAGIYVAIGTVIARAGDTAPIAFMLATLVLAIPALVVLPHAGFVEDELAR